MPIDIAVTAPYRAKVMHAIADQNSINKNGFANVCSGRNINGPQIAHKMATGTIESIRINNGENVRPENKTRLNARTRNVTTTITNIILTIFIICSYLNYYYHLKKLSQKIMLLLLRKLQQKLNQAGGVGLQKELIYLWR